jgi:hypothetical protein
MALPFMGAVPARAGIHVLRTMDARLRGHDDGF